jgi:histidyl-tRNA synthetase
MIEQVLPIIQLTGTNRERLQSLENLIGSSAEGKAGIEELETIISYLENINLNSAVEIDQSLARGLNYYTGAIIEVKAKNVDIGSVCGGGRYDNLTGIFGLPDVSGVGVSFGADRIYDALNELNLFPEQVLHSSEALLVNFGEKEGKFALKILQLLQEKGIKAELFPDVAKLKKQMRYADQKGIRYVILIGEEEIKTGHYTLKDMKTGDQSKAIPEEIIRLIKTS